MESHSKRHILPKNAGNEYIKVISSPFQEILGTRYLSRNDKDLNLYIEYKSKAIFLMKNEPKSEFQRRKSESKIFSKKISIIKKIVCLCDLGKVKRKTTEQKFLIKSFLTLFQHVPPPPPPSGGRRLHAKKLLHVTPLVT